MSKRTSREITRSETDDTLWPDKLYFEKIEKLKSLIGQKIYLIEAMVTEINASIHHSGKAYTLLSIIDYPQPDHKTGLLPHNIIVDDGRGINLGRIVQISTDTAFNPSAQNIAYNNPQLLDEIYPQWKRLGNYSLEDRSKNLLANILGKPETENQQNHNSEENRLSNNSSDTGEEQS